MTYILRRWIWRNLFSFLKKKHYILRVIYRCRDYIFSKITYVNTEGYVSIRSARIMSLTSADYPFDKYGLCLWKLPSMLFYLTFSTLPLKLVHRLLGNWASSQDHSKQFIKQQINKKIKWRIHQSHNTRFMWKTPNPQKNHGCCRETTREKYSLCGKLLQPLSEIIFSPKPQIHYPDKYFLTKQPHNTHIEELNTPLI